MTLTNQDYNAYQLATPHEFRVACALTNFKAANLLQKLIDHITLFDTMAKVSHLGYTQATRAFEEYALSDEFFKNFKVEFELHPKVMAALEKITRYAEVSKGDGLTEREKCKLLVAKMYPYIRRKYVKTDIVVLEDGQRFLLSKDYVIICELYYLNPLQYLEYFMSRISIAETHARDDLKIYVQNLELLGFLTIVDRLRSDKDNVVPINKVDEKFINHSLQHRVSLFNVRNLEERIKILQNSYAEQYYKLKLSNLYL